MTDKELVDEILKKLEEVSSLYMDLTDYNDNYQDFEEGLSQSIGAMELRKADEKILDVKGGRGIK